MFRRILATMLSAVILCTALGFQMAEAQTTQDVRLAEKARANVQKRGVGRDARVEVKLRDNTKLKGYISAAGEDSFTLMDSKTGASRTVDYADVTEVKRPGNAISTRTLIILGAAAVATAIVGVTVIKPVLCDGGAGC